MKKTTKGAVAAGAAALLLAGGAGTMAAWNASTTGGAAQTVTAGSMSIAQDGAGVWKWGGTGTNSGTAFNPASDKLVPGDVVTYTANYKFDLVGTNLKATLTPSLGGVTGALLPQLDVAAATGTPTVYSAGLNQSATYTTTITFKPATANQVGASQTADLAGGVVTLEQKLTP